MAILESAPLDIPLAGGLAENVDPRVLPPGSFAVLENLVQNKAGAFSKRYGFGEETNVNDQAGAVAEPVNLLCHQGQPVAVAREAPSAPAVYQFDNGARWRARGRVEFSRLTHRADVSQPTGSVFFEALHRLAASPKALVAALWVESPTNLTSPGAGSALYYRIFDAETGVQTIARSLFSTTNGNSFASCAFDATRVLFAQLNAAGTAYVVSSLTATTGLQSTVATIAVAAGAAAAVDLVPYSPTHFAVALRDGGNVRLQIRAVAGGALSVQIAVPVAAATIVSVAMLDDGATKRFWVVLEDGGVAKAFTATSTGPANLVLGAGLTTIDATMGALLRIAPGAVDLPATLGPSCLVALSDANLKTNLHLVDFAAAVSETALLPASMATTKPVLYDERLWMTVATHAAQSQTPTGLANVGTTCLISVEVDEELVVPRLSAVFARLETTLDQVNATQAPPLAAFGPSASFECPARVFSAVGQNLRFGARWVRAHANQYAGGAHQYDECNGGLMVSGGHVAWLDGAFAVELGFVNDPKIISVGQAAGAGSVAAGTYDVFACYEYTDAMGVLHRSAPSAPVRVVVAAPNTTLTVNVATTGILAIAGFLRRPVAVHVFRTLAGPGPDVYRLTSQVTAPQNDPNATQVSFVTTLSDAQVAALGLGFLYTSAEVPARTPPAAGAVLVHKGRAWVAEAGALGRVFPSKPVRAGLAPEFADEFAVDLPQAAGPVTALAGLDDDTVAYTETQVYLISGDGPLPNGQGSAFGVVRVPSEHGCLGPGSVVVTDQGVFFQSARGICLLGRDRAVVYAGAAVEELTKTFPVARAALVDQRRRRVLWLMRSAEAAFALAAVICFDLDTGVWSNWTVSAATVVGHAMCSGEHWVATTGGFGKEAGASCRDFGEYVSSVLETPWIRVGGLVQHQRTRRWALAADRPDPCELVVEAYVDFDLTSAQAWTIDLGPTTRVEAPDHPRLSEQIAPQKHSAIKLRFTDIQAGSDTTSLGRGLDYAALQLDIAGKKGLAKVAAGNRS